MPVRQTLIAACLASLAIALPAHAESSTGMSAPATYAVQMPVPPFSPPPAGRYDGGWRGSWQDHRTYHGDWSGTYEANAPQADPAAASWWLGECRQRLTAAGQLGDQTRIADACSSWLGYFQAVGPNQPASLYAIPVMLVPVMTPRTDCVTHVEVLRPAHRHPARQPRILRDKRVRILPD